MATGDVGPGGDTDSRRGMMMDDVGLLLHASSDLSMGGQNSTVGTMLALSLSLCASRALLALPDVLSPRSSLGWCAKKQMRL